jgi:hypothetical protein
MIVVTGLRSGTSLIMQTLKLLGFPIAGYMFHDDFSHKELNPKGYYDLPIKETLFGLNTDKYKGKAVKLGGYQLSMTRPKYVNKILVCERSKQDAVKSIVKLMKAEYDLLKIEPNKINAENVYEINNSLINKSIKDKAHIRIKYEEMLLSPEKTIYKICKFLNIKTDIEIAVNNVEKRELCLSQQ